MAVAPDLHRRHPPGAARRADQVVDDVLPGQCPQRVRREHHGPCAPARWHRHAAGPDVRLLARPRRVSFRTGYRLGGAIVGGTPSRAGPGGRDLCRIDDAVQRRRPRRAAGRRAAAHWYYITRYPLGLDATVSDSQTMRFRNDTGPPVLIRASIPGRRHSRSRSVPTADRDWSKPRVTNVVRGYDTSATPRPCAPGARRIEYPVDGKDVSTRGRCATLRARHPRDTFVSHYHRMVGVTLVGR